MASTGKIWTSFEREPESVKRRDPKENRERIDRHDHTSDIEDRQDIHDDDGPECGRGAEDSLGKIIKKQAGAGREDGTPETNAKLVVTKDGGAAADRERDARAFTEIRKSRALRPKPVI